jgi:6-oxocyclohex-1-ene-carbonyl-CoA hydrolase
MLRCGTQIIRRKAMLAEAVRAAEPGVAAKEHTLVAETAWRQPAGGARYEKRPVKGMDGKPVAGLYNAWITLDNPSQFNSYTTEMVKATILAFRAASAARDVVAVVFTGSGDKAFCTGGNTKEYAEYYAGNPQEYRGYMRLFNDMVSAILACDKPVICRVNGMRIGGGQEIGMACDFSIAQDLARFGQAGPKHGSAPLGGATDFLPVTIGTERAMVACVLCEPFSAHEAYLMGMISDIVPALKIDGKFVANPLVETARMVDEYGRLVFGKPKTGEALKAGQELMKRGTVDLALLDEKVESLCTKLLYTFPDCTTKTVEELRKPKLDAWNRNKENSRAWLALNMMTEARAGFRAFNEGTRETGREVDFIALRRWLAANTPWSEQLTESIMPRAKKPS